MLEWVANARMEDVRATRRSERGNGRGRGECVVSVEMGDVDAGALEFLNLGDCFAFDFFFANVWPAQETLNEVDKEGRKVFCRRAEKLGNALRSEAEFPWEEDVRSRAESRIGMGDGDGVLEGGAGGHQGSGGDGLAW